MTYFRYASAKGHLERMDKWIRRKLRCVRGEIGLLVVGLVEAGCEDGLDGSVAQHPGLESAAAGGVHALGGIGAP